MTDPRRLTRRIILTVLGMAAVLVCGSVGILQLWPEPRQAVSTIVNAPSHVEAFSGRGYISITWSRVRGAVSYRIFRADRAEGEYRPIDISRGPMSRIQRRILAWLLPGLSFEDVAGALYTDTAVKAGSTYYYRIAAWDGTLLSAFSDRASAEARSETPRPISIHVDASRDAGNLDHNWATLINSEHLSYEFKGDLNSHLRTAGQGLRLENKQLHDVLGFQYVRAHGILSDDLGVYREDSSGHPIYNWAAVDKLYDMLLADGMKPFVELSFMPAALALDPRQTVFAYKGITSPPKSYEKWGGLIHAFVQHLVDRYGRQEVQTWYFEVWNEPDLHMPLFGNFWHGTNEEYFRLYDSAADAVKSVDPRLRVGGPAAATPAFIRHFLNHVATSASATRQDRVPLDFVSYHAYSSPFIDWRPILERLGFARLPVFYTEWGVSPRVGEVVNDLPYGAAWLTRVLVESNDVAGISSYWTGSEYSDEQKPPKAFFHGGFGLLGFDAIRKPRYWAYFLLQQMGTQKLKLAGEGEGFGALVQGLATASPDGTVRVLLANVAYQQTKVNGDEQLERRVSLTISGLMPNQAFVLHHYRIDNSHSNVYAAWQALGKPDWPDAGQLAALHRHDSLEMFEPAPRICANDHGQLTLDFDLPMPAVSMVELSRPPNEESGRSVSVPAGNSNLY